MSKEAESSLQKCVPYTYFLAHYLEFSLKISTMPPGICFATGEKKVKHSLCEMMVYNLFIYFHQTGSRGEYNKIKQSLKPNFRHPFPGYALICTDAHLHTHLQIMAAVLVITPRNESVWIL